MSLAPIALFVYNRPYHTKLTVEALLQNALADQSDLFIFSDAASSAKEETAVSQVRQFIKSIKGFKKVHIIEKEMNSGLASSVIDGVSSICKSHGKVIVLEDDLITSLNFLSYMNDCLNIYEKEEKVMHISGYMFPIDNKNLPDTFFLRMTTCWGWATWNRAWLHFKKNPQKLFSKYTEEDIYYFNMDGSYNFWDQVKRNHLGQINTWAVFWYASVVEVGGMCVHPSNSMVNNIGHDNSGENCVKGNVFSISLTGKKIQYFEPDIRESYLAKMRTIDFFKSISCGRVGRFISKIKKYLHS